MSGHGFTSAFATELDAYLAFKANMGFTGASRIWYLKQFDAYCAAMTARCSTRTPLKAGSVFSCNVQAATGLGCPTSVTSAAG